MSNKAFGVKELNLIGDQGAFPVIESSGNLSLNAPTVAISTNATVGGILTATTYYGDGSNLTGVSGGIGTNTNINTTGIITAASFFGDGSGLTGITAVGSGVVVQDEGILVGTAATINFIGNQVTASILNGICSVNVGAASYADVAGIATVAQNLTGSPSISVGTITCVDDINIQGATPTWRLQDTDASENYAYMQYDSSAGPGLLFRLRCFQNVPNFRIQGEGSGTPDTSDFVTIVGGSPTSATYGYVGVNDTSPDERLSVGGNIKATGIVTATAFYGDGSNLTGIVAAGSGVVIQEEGSSVGTASTINFVGAAVTATFSGGVATINISPAVSTGSGGKFIDNAAGIHTTSAVGIKTELPRSDLQVGILGLQSGIGTFIAAAGTPSVIDQFNISANNFKTAEYTVHIQHANGIQSQKILVMQDGAVAYSNEFAIMYNSMQLVSVGSTISSGVCQLQVTPQSGITGITTYRFSRQSLL